MLEKIGIENFKAFGEYTEVKLRDLNIITGLNSAGKSTIYHAILLLIQSQGKYIDDDYGNRLAYLEINGPLIELGRYDEIMYNPEKGYIRFCLHWSDGTKVDSYYKLEKDDKGKKIKENILFIICEFELSRNGEVIVKARKYKKKNRWFVEAYQLLTFNPAKIGTILFDNIRSKLGEHQKTLERIFLERVKFRNVLDVFLSAYSLEAFDIKFADIGMAVKEELRDKIDWSELKNDARKEKISTKTACLFNADSYDHKTNYGIEEKKFMVLPPFRGYPQRIYTESGQPNPLKRYLESKDEIKDFAWDFKKKRPKFDFAEKAFHYWIVKHFQIAEAVNVKETIPSLATEIILSIDGKDVPINNVGFGISQLIPVVFGVLNSDDEQLCIVDEPEIHLHPSLQSKLADFFMHMALIGKRIAIETHSEYLIDKLIFLKLKHNIDDDKINLIWVKKDEKGAYIEDVKYDDLGYIINPPDGFLSEKKKLVEELSKIRLTKL